MDGRMRVAAPFAVDLRLLYDYRKAIQIRLRRRWNMIVPYEQITLPCPTSIDEVNEDILHQVTSVPQFYADMPVRDGALEAVDYLRQYGKIFVFSSRPAVMRNITLIALGRDFGTMIIAEDTKEIRPLYMGKSRAAEANIQGVHWAFEADPKEALAYARRRIHCTLVVNEFTAHYKPNRFILEAESFLDAVHRYDSLYVKE